MEREKKKYERFAQIGYCECSKNSQDRKEVLWCRLRGRGYTRCPESLYRVLKRQGALPEKSEKQQYSPKPYEEQIA